MILKDFCEKYEPIVKYVARKLVRKNQIEYADLYQEGMLSLILLFNYIQKNKIKYNKSYINIIVKGALLKYISNNTSIINVASHTFFNDKFVNHTFKNLNTQFSTDAVPQDKLLINKEQEAALSVTITMLRQELPEKELFVLDNIILAEKPLSYQQAADFLGYKSKTSIKRLKKKVINEIEKCMED